MTRTYLYLTIFLLPVSLMAQNDHPQVLSTAAGYYVLATGSVDFTLGEILTHSYQFGGTIEHGFLHFFDIKKLSTSNYQAAIINSEVNVWPNPASSLVQVQVDFSARYVLSLWDTQGRLVMQHDVFQPQAEINVHHLPSQEYLLTVSTEGTIRTQTKLFIIH